LIDIVVIMKKKVGTARFRTRNGDQKLQSTHLRSLTTLHAKSHLSMLLNVQLAARLTLHPKFSETRAHANPLTLFTPSTSSFERTMTHSISYFAIRAHPLLVLVHAKRHVLNIIKIYY